MSSVADLFRYAPLPNGRPIATFWVTRPRPTLVYFHMAPVLLRRRVWVVIHGCLHVFIDFDGFCIMSLLGRRRPRTSRRVLVIRETVALRSPWAKNPIFTIVSNFIRKFNFPRTPLRWLPESSLNTPWVKFTVFGFIRFPPP